MRRVFLHLPLLFVASSQTAIAQDDWPQFRGPGGMGVSSAKGLPVTWSQKENIVWKTPLPGAGTSSPILVGDKIYLTAYTGYNVPGKRGEMSDLKLHLLCLKRSDGAIIWDKEIAPKLPEQPRIRDDHGYASSTPACDGQALYLFFGKSGAFAFDLDGKQLWQTDVGSTLNDWGSAASPVLYKDLVFINASVESQSLFALDKKTGVEKLRAKGIREAWNTPLLVPVGGKTELIVPIMGEVLAFDPDSGDRLWSCKNEIGWYIVPSAVAEGGIVYSIGGRSGVAAVAVRAGGRGDVTKSHRLWTSRKGCNVSSPIIHEGRLHWMHDSGIACAADLKTGNLLYEERVERADQVYASALLADGKLFYVSRPGRTFVLAAGPKYQLLASNDLRDGGMFNASPVAAGNRLYLRSEKFLYCIGAR